MAPAERFLRSTECHVNERPMFQSVSSRFRRKGMCTLIEHYISVISRMVPANRLPPTS